MKHEMKHRVCHWFYCHKCGLVNMKNGASTKALDKDCPGAKEDLDKVEVRLRK